MTEVDPLGPEFAYVQVANALAASIQAGEITGRLPAERELAVWFGVSYQTLRHSIGVLRERGLVVTRLGRGSFVTRLARPEPPS